MPLKRTWPALAILALPPAAVAAFAIFGPFITDALPLFGGMSYQLRPGLFGGTGTIDPNFGFTAFALGLRSALDAVSGALPLWNHYEGLGAPLLGEMQAASLFPPTLLLLLPHGQVIEQATLQALAGVGAYLFLRRLGLATFAALVGGLLFEFNGVFAWLRNAIFNPVAFLPWLFYAIESLAVATADRRRWRERIPTIVVGVFAGALSLYAGFPEVTYLYALLAALWAFARGVALGRQVVAYVADLALVAGLTLVVAAPLLLAFVSFLGQAELGGHRDDLFASAILPPPALLMYMLPYVYGPIFASSHPVVASIWGSIGGYLGLMPLLLGIAGLICTWRRPTSWLLAGWIVLAIGASQGAPLLHAAFITLPLAKITAYCRYLNAGWIFCAVVLAALFIDRLPALTRPQRLAAGAASGAATLALLIGAAVAAWPVLAELARPHGGHRLAIALSLGAGLALLAAALTVLAIAGARRARTVLAALAIAEALAAFILPIASFPRDGRVDRALISFLQKNIGLQRVANAPAGIAPNFGAALGIKLINYDDLPVPRRTVDYTRTHIDPAADAIMFRLRAPTNGPDWRAAFIASIPAYAAAGVRYILAGADLFASQAYGLVDEPPVAIGLLPGKPRAFDLRRGAGEAVLGGIAIRLGTYGGRSDGTLHVLLCQAADCVHGEADVTAAADNGALLLRLGRPLTLNDGDAYRMILWTQATRYPVALWMRHADAPQHALLPETSLIGAGKPMPVLTTRTTAVFEIAGARPYFQADGCAITPISSDRLLAQCQNPSRLVRLEVAMDGWTVRINGAPAAIAPIEDTFQGVDLPSGRSTVEFIYAPPGVRPLAWVALATVLSLIATVLYVSISHRVAPA